MVGAAAIEIRQLGFTYPGEAEAALTDISFTIAAGSCFGLLGPNGAGKSTLLSLLTGILPLQSGTVSILGQPLAGISTLHQAGQHRKSTSLVPQDYAFYQALTARENLECFAGLYGLSGNTRRERIDFAVTVCGLESLLDKRAAQCSGGVRRRLNLAIGLLNRPRILYLDEPTVGIDAQSRHFILASIQQLQAEGVTIVYTSHYLEEIQAICDALAIIDHGRLLLADTMEHVMERAASMPSMPARQDTKRLEDFYLSLTQHTLRD